MRHQSCRPSCCLQETLEDISFSFDGGPTLNFAEGAALSTLQRLTVAAETESPAGAAALLIQGTACIYSRKVEHLHALVYQALDVVVECKCVLLVSLRQKPQDVHMTWLLGQEEGQGQGHRQAGP